MFVFVYSSYHLKLSFPHPVVILKTLETPKMPNIKTAAKQVWLYFIHRTTQPGYSGTTTNLQILNTQKNPYLTPQKKLAKFSYPKKSQNKKFQIQKNPSIIPVTWNSKYPPPPPPPPPGSRQGEDKTFHLLMTYLLVVEELRFLSSH